MSVARARPLAWSAAAASIAMALAGAGLSAADTGSALGHSLVFFVLVLALVLPTSIVGALVGMVRRRLERGEAAEIPGLLPTMLQFALTPYLGAERAGALVLASRS